MRRVRQWAAATLLAWLAALVAGGAGPCFGQIAPGPLHRAHAFLEGTQNCSRCHGGRQEVVSDKCLDCHGAIRERREAERGLHGREDHGACPHCHVEHQGPESSLIYWEGGQASFDHALAGFVLEGKHAALPCRQCHRQELITEKSVVAAKDVARERTFLGLGRECASCHVDEHRGQLAGSCGACHDTRAWQPASGFDHQRTGYPLTGRHAAVTCARCHRTEVDGRAPQDPDFRRLAPLAHERCTACHADPHGGRLGVTCESCHTTSGWLGTRAGGFDHHRTRFPLAGAHARVTCERCHDPGRPRRVLRFAACRDCHADYHQGGFADRAAGGACEECHTVEGFSPAAFGLAQHAATAYPLGGAHRAVACDACHVERAAGEGAKSYRFSFVSTRCPACHLDPHGGEAERFAGDRGCEACHTVEGWREVGFDHALTGFGLEGRHLTVSCRRCHPAGDRVAGEPASGRAAIPFRGAPRACAGCHPDAHRGQFGPAAECARCHTPASWRAEKFDHGRDAAFRLTGAHRRVPCRECHPRVSDPTGEWVVYKPRPTACASCHGEAIPAEGRTP